MTVTLPHYYATFLFYDGSIDLLPIILPIYHFAARRAYSYRFPRRVSDCHIPPTPAVQFVREERLYFLPHLTSCNVGTDAAGGRILFRCARQKHATARPTLPSPSPSQQRDVPAELYCTYQYYHTQRLAIIHSIEFDSKALFAALRCSTLQIHRKIVQVIQYDEAGKSAPCADWYVRLPQPLLPGEVLYVPRSSLWPIVK